MENRLKNKKDIELFIIEHKNSKKRTILNCGGNLFFVLLPSGTCYFISRQKVNGKDITKTLGHYPDISIPEAREKIKKIKIALKAEKELKQESYAPTFGSYSQEWLAFFNVKENGNGFHKNNKRFLSVRGLLRVLADLNDYPLDKITPVVVDKHLSKSDKTQVTKYNAIRILNQCLNSAVVDGLIETNPCANMLNVNGLISRKYKKPKVIGYAWAPAEELKEKYFDKLRTQIAQIKVFIAIQALTCLRGGSVAALEWSWIDFDKKIITIPEEFMKMSREFCVPLTTFMESLLKKWQKHCKIEHIESKYVFVSKTKIGEPLRLAAVQVALTSVLNGEVTMHGMRKSARTWMASIGVPEVIAEYALSHIPKNKIVNIYNKHDYLKERMPVMRLWNYYLYSQMPEEFKKLFGDLPDEYLNKCRKDLEDQQARIAIFNGIEDI